MVIAHGGSASSLSSNASPLRPFLARSRGPRRRLARSAHLAKTLDKTLEKSLRRQRSVLREGNKMQNDDVIWDVIRHHHCSYMAKIQTGNFCRNPYNVTGICNRSSCPLANSRYATIRDHDGVFYLYMKTIERAHMPNKLWERVKLPKNYMKALEIIDKHMEYWPKLLVHKIKQRLTKMTQYRIRMVKLSKKVREKIMTVPRKEKKRESRREEKALKAAQIENVIEKELLERLNKGVYPDICNYNEEIFNKLLDKNKEEEQEEEEEEEAEVEYVEGDYELEEEELEDDIEDLGDFLNTNNLEDMDEDEDELEEQPSNKKIKRAVVSYPSKKDDATEKVKRKGKKVIVEVERDEDVDERQHNEIRVMQTELLFRRLRTLQLGRTT